ncbi:MAG: DUF1080 domain-containing protein [Bryobacter sp.]|jgi:hypothetical protein|nr:DUF1080 domain-containing protein [Bryobacter sp.]
MPLTLLLALTLAQSWQPMFDGVSLGGWREVPFSGKGVLRVANGAIVMEAGEPFTGVSWTRPFPRADYEIRFDARRVAGGDFFASLTFPVADSHATFVTGGWGGDIIGISSIEGWDASENETRSYFSFENGRWYRFRLQVTAQRIQVWIDDDRVIDLAINGRTISLRPGDTARTTPLGFFSYRSSGAIRAIEFRPLRP